MIIESGYYFSATSYDKIRFNKTRFNKIRFNKIMFLALLFHFKFLLNALFRTLKIIVLIEKTRD